MPPQPDDRMIARMPGELASAPGASVQAVRPKFAIVIPAADGTELLRMTEDERGFLSVTGDESRWDEGAKRFLHGMMQWSGAIGIRWKDEAVQAAEGQR